MHNDVICGFYKPVLMLNENALHFSVRNPGSLTALFLLLSSAKAGGAEATQPLRSLEMLV